MSTEVKVFPNQVLKGRITVGSYLPKLQFPLSIRGPVMEEYDGTKPITIYTVNYDTYLRLVMDVDELNKDVADMNTRLANMEYVPIAFESAEALPDVRQTGQVQAGAFVSWKLNKVPEKLEIDGKEIKEEDLHMGTLQEGTYDYLRQLTSDSTITITATDERMRTVQESRTVKFVPGVYYGVVADGVAVDSGRILRWFLSLQADRRISFTVNAGEGQRIGFALPHEYGSGSGSPPAFYVGGFEGGFYQEGCLFFKNAHGHEEMYEVWLSSNTGLGETTVIVE